MDNPEPVVCPFCACPDQVEIVIEHARRKGCYCSGCGKTFSVDKGLTDQQADRARRLAE